MDPPGEHGSSCISLCVASWNIHRCVGTDGGCDPARVARVLEELACDPIGLQEVDNSPGPTPTSRQLDYLADSTRMRPIAGMRIIRHRGHYGNALLTRRRVIAERRHDLSIARREPRGVLDVELDVEGLPLRFLVTHLGLGPLERRYQMRRLLEIVTSAPEGEPIVLLGDINEWWPHGRLLRSLHLLFGRPPAISTFPARMPFLALDRIWSRPRDSLVAISAHRSALARVASDHLPVVATLCFDRTAAARRERILIAGGGG
jgi:endonuclease/exonuclease/phosphatase family metal-dependent hydrolase